MHTTPPIDPAAIAAQLKWRYAVKKFDATKKIPSDQWAAIENALVQSPSSYGLQPWRFVTVSNPALRAQLRTVSWNQSQITDASHLVVLARKIEVTPADVEAYIARIQQVRGVPAEALKDYKGMMVGSVSNPAGLPGGSMDTYTRSQVYIALGFALFAAAALGIDACPMEGFDPAKYDEMLGLPALGYKASVVATFGYRDPTDFLANLAKVRETPEHLFIRK